MINLKVGCVSRLHCFITTLRFQLFRTLWITIQAKNSIRNAPASSALALVSHQSHNVHTANLYLCVAWQLLVPCSQLLQPLSWHAVPFLGPLNFAYKKQILLM